VYSLPGELCLSFPLRGRLQAKSCFAPFPVFEISLLCMVQSVRLTKFDYRLANKLDPDMQKLRCRTNYKVLQLCLRAFPLPAGMKFFHS
jgi:hypothetical protein